MNTSTCPTRDARRADLRHLLHGGKCVPVYLDRRGRAAETLAPYSVELHLTSRCNYNCCHCSYAERNTAQADNVDRETVRRAVAGLASLRPAGVYFSGGGESTLLSGFEDHARVLDQAGAALALVTNGTRLASFAPETLARFHYIALSVYSTDKAAYERITGGRFFEGQFSMPSLVRHADTVRGARCVINEHNVTHVLDVYRAALDAGFDYVIFIPAVDYENRRIGLSASEVAGLKERIEANLADIDPRSTNLERLLHSDFSYYTHSEEYGDTCQAVALRSHAFLNYDGEVYLCQPLIGDARFSIGNLAKADLTELWNGPRHREVAERLLNDYPLPQCDICRCKAYNVTMRRFDGLPPNTPFEVMHDPFL